MGEWLARLRSFVRGLRAGDRLEREMAEEMRFHIEREAERLVGERGLSAQEARRQAHVTFGSAARYRDEGRDVRGLTGVAGLSLDARLGARMLARYPGVSLIGVLAIAIGVGLGAAYLEVVSDVISPTLPFAEGERIVGLQNWDAAERDPELRSSHDFARWREHLRAVTELSAFRSIDRNVSVSGAGAEPVRGAEMTASGFRVARVPALLGRTLQEEDEREGAPPVIVLGHELWRTGFAGDPGVVGRVVQLGRSTATVVGIMPEGFAFPLSDEFWLPLRRSVLSSEPRQGPPIHVFGRLGPGVTPEEAQAELTAAGQRAAADFPGTHEHLRPRVVPYTQLFVGGEGSVQAYLVSLLFVLLLLILAANVATMVFARTATRENEILMRFALGASRRRILTQFFVEALVLALIAAGLGLAIVAWGSARVTQFFWNVIEGRRPFWLVDGVSLNTTTILYALMLAIVVALVAGVIPALKATGPRLQARLRQPTGGGASALRFGGVWSAMTVVQVAFAVLILPPAMIAVGALAEPGYVDPGFAGAEYLSAELAIEPPEPPADTAAREELFGEFQLAAEELRRRLLAAPGVSRVTFATHLPVMDHAEPWVEAESESGITDAHWVMTSAVEPDFFETFGADIVAGRVFDAGDLRPDARVVVVNEHFVEEFLDGRNAIGRRVRYATREPSQWYEIVGVVGGLGMDTNRDPFYPGYGPGVYFPLTAAAMAAGDGYRIRVALHVRGAAAAFAPQLRSMVHAIDPELRLREVLPLDRAVDRVNRNERVLSRVSSWGTALVAFIALLISTAGVYALMSFTVARQTREIGIRIALGADPRRIVTGVFSRAMLRIGIGIVVGTLLWLVTARALGGGPELQLLLMSAVVLALVGLIACGVPVRRALRIEPTEALREG